MYYYCCHCLSCICYKPLSPAHQPADQPCFIALPVQLLFHAIHIRVVALEQEPYNLTNNIDGLHSQCTAGDRLTDVRKLFELELPLLSQTMNQVTNASLAELCFRFVVADGQEGSANPLYVCAPTVVQRGSASNLSSHQ